MKTVIGWLLALLSVLGFASTFIIGAALTKDCGVSPIVLSLMRFSVAGTVMLVVGISTRKGRVRLLSVPRRDWRKLAWLGPIGTSVMAWCVFMGCARVSAANASMADALTPLMIFAVAALKAWRIERRELIGLFCGLAGAVLVVQVVNADGLALEAYTVGDVYILLAAATWGVYTVYGHEQITRLGSSVFTTWTMLIGAAFLGVVLIPLSITTSFLHLVWPSTMKSWSLVFALGLVSTLMPFWTWNAAQKYLPMSVLGITAYFTPVFAIAMAIVFLGESTTSLQWFGTVLIIASAFIETGSRKIAKGVKDMRLFINVVLVALLFGGCVNCSERSLPKNGRLVMATEQAEGRIAVVDKSGVIWEWNPKNDVGIATNDVQYFTNPDECKGRDNGRTILMTASGGAFAVIDVDEKRAKCYGFVGGNPHSVDRLPDGRYVVASSNGNKLTLVDVSGHLLEPSAQRKKEFVFEDAHGVHWDAQRKVLWAIGGAAIAKFTYDASAMDLKLLKSFPLAEVGLAWGHDLVEDGNDRLAFTANNGCGWFDRNKEAFVNCSTDRPRVKSQSFDEDDSLSTVPKERWWTDEIHLKGRHSSSVYIVPGALFYKARFLIRK